MSKIFPISWTTIGSLSMMWKINWSKMDHLMSAEMLHPVLLQLVSHMSQNNYLVLEK